MKNELLLHCLQTETVDMLSMLENALRAHGYHPDCDMRWCYAPGTIPLLLVAHVDTVHDGAPQTVYHDSARGVVWSPTGLGADDRAGVYGILSLLERGYRPHVLFTDEEEIGGRGAEDVADGLAPPDVRLMIQLDRAGADDCVFYSCANRKAERYVNAHGFKTARGSFTDISVLMPSWGIAGVNLSIGYYNQHTLGEYLSLPECHRTLERVERMLKAPPSKLLRYKPVKSVLPSWQWGDCPGALPWDEFGPEENGPTLQPSRCDCCDRDFPADFLNDWKGQNFVCDDCMEMLGEES